MTGQFPHRVVSVHAVRPVAAGHHIGPGGSARRWRRNSATGTGGLPRYGRRRTPRRAAHRAPGAGTAGRLAQPARQPWQHRRL